jgi:hypothetical protein
LVSDYLERIVERQFEGAATQCRGAAVRLADGYAKIRIDFGDACGRVAAAWQRRTSR